MLGVYDTELVLLGWLVLHPGRHMWCMLVLGITVDVCGVQTLKVIPDLSGPTPTPPTQNTHFNAVRPMLSQMCTGQVSALQSTFQNTFC